MTILVAILGLNLIYGGAQVDFCYSIEEGSGNLYRIAQDGSSQSTVGQIAECSVEAIAWDRIGELWMFDAATNAFYTLNLVTAISTFKHAAPTFIRSDNGQVHQIKDVDALDFDAFDTTKLWCVERVPGPSPDLLFAFDTVTGQVVGNVGYPVTGVAGDIDDIGVDPINNTMFAISNNNGSGDQLVIINPFNGNAFLVGNLLEAGIQINNMEGFGFDVDGQLIGTTGECSDPISGGLYFIDKNSGASNLLTVIDAVNSDIESIACFNARIELTCFTITEGLSPYTVDDPIFNQVVAINDFCCDTDWDASCQQLYDDLNALPPIERNCIECPILTENGCGDAFISPILTISNCSIEVEGACPDGSTLEYSVEDGPWDVQVPTVNDQVEEMISIRCRCDEDESVISDAVTEASDPDLCMCNPVMPMFVPQGPVRQN